jgi:aryl-alcohol dehydrogenase-like predicted oxidoreductase
MKYILGTANFGNMYKDLMVGNKLAVAILNKAWDLGIRDIDTARTYGMSERMIGDYIKWTGNKFRVWTKGRSEQDYEESKKELGVTPHAFLWHNYELTDEIPCHIDGISSYNAEFFKRAYDQNNITILQTQWNIIDRRNEWYSKLAKQFGLTTVARSIFIRGEAFKMPALAGAPFWQWCLDVPDCFDYAVIGADTPEQLEQIVTAQRIELTYTGEGIKCQRLS